MGEADNPPIGTGPFKFVSWDRSAASLLSGGTKIIGASRQKSMKSFTKISKKTPRGLQRLNQARPISSATFRRMRWSDLNLIRACACSRCRGYVRSFSF